MRGGGKRRALELDEFLPGLTKAEDKAINLTEYKSTVSGDP